MAKRRMLSIPIVETDKFYSLSTEAQALYVHLNLNADDDGVVSKVKLILSQMNLTKKYYKELISAEYILEVDSGLIVITHWHQHNKIRKDRYVAGEYLDEISALSLQENGRYIKGKRSVLVDKCVPQDRIGKDSLVKASTDEGSLAEQREEKKREEKENLSLFHSDIHSTAAQRPSQQADNAHCDKNNESDDLSQYGLLNAIKLYFMRKYQSLESNEFIKYYEQRGWMGEQGRLSVDNYKAYADEWMQKK